MLCHLPPNQEHAAVSWRITVRFLGTFTEPGIEPMHLCTECFEDWTTNSDQLDVVVLDVLALSARARGASFGHRRSKGITRPGPEVSLLPKSSEQDG
jgi:hypothetical protein